MPDVAPSATVSESQFAALVDAMAGDPGQRAQLTDLLHEDHVLYRQRGAATVVRMRGWVLLAMGRTGLSDAELVFVLEELDTGVDPYLMAAAARALRSYATPTAALAPFVMRALTNIRYRDEPVSFEAYGEYAAAATATSAVRELLASLAWLGPRAQAIRPELEALRRQVGVRSTKLRVDIDRTLQAIPDAVPADEPVMAECCCPPPASGATWVTGSRRDNRPIETLLLEDHCGERIAFKAFFHGQPSIVVFFYTRCDNPLKCSLTISKLGRVQQMLAAQGLAARIRTAAITYDPAFDVPERLRVYGQDRGVRLDAGHRMLRTVGDNGNETLRRYFELGVNFVESLVNRHRIEVYVLDTEGRIAALFERLHWDEAEVVARAIEVLQEKAAQRD
jgi:cytochrome oxidase Cu insertion factor (SCO1/SenC/PrrC family)